MVAVLSFKMICYTATDSVTKKVYVLGSGCSPPRKPINRPGWWKGEFVFRCRHLGEAGGHLSEGQLLPPTLATRGARALTDGRRGHVQEQTVGSASQLQIGQRWSDQGHLVVLGTVHLRFQGPRVPISLRPVLRIVAACVMDMVWSPCSQLLPPVVLVSRR